MIPAFFTIESKLVADSPQLASDTILCLNTNVRQEPLLQALRLEAEGGSVDGLCSFRLDLSVPTKGPDANGAVNVLEAPKMVDTKVSKNPLTVRGIGVFDSKVCSTQ